LIILMSRKGVDAFIICACTEREGRLMTDHADVPSGRRRGRRQKDQKRLPLSLRVTPQMRESLEGAAQRTGRSLTQETEMLLDYALLLLDRSNQEFDDDREFRDLYYRPPAPSAELVDRLLRLEGEIAKLRAAVETGLERSTIEFSRTCLRLQRLIAEFDAKLLTTTSEMATAVSHLQTVTAHLLAALKKVDAAPTDRRREPTDASARPRLVVKPGSEA
jgi:hypothetical protein